MSKYPPVRIVSPAQFDTATAQTPGSLRRAALAPNLGMKTGMWGGLFIVEPESKTGIHHHGEQETIAYVLEGECRVRWGEHGEFSAVARQGDFIHVPAWLPHMEVNESRDHPFEWVVVRSTATPIVVNSPITSGLDRHGRAAGASAWTFAASGPASMGSRTRLFAHAILSRHGCMGGLAE